MNAATPSSDPQGAARRWRALAVICIGVILSMTPWFSATAILPELKLHLGMGETAAAWMTNAVQLGFVIGALASSITALPDLVSPHRLMAVCALVGTGLNLALLAAPNAEVAIVLRFLTGMTLSGVYPPAMKLVTTWFVRGRGLALGFVIGCLTLGSAFPHLVRAFSSSLDWTLVVTVTSAMSLVAAGIFQCLAREGPNAYAKAEFQPRQIGRILRNRGVALANLGYFGHMWELYAMWGWFLAFASVAIRSHGIDASALASVLTFAVVAIGGLGAVIAGWLADRIGRTATTSLMLGISGFCGLAIGFAFDGPMWLLVLLSLLWGLTIVADSAQFSAMVTELSERTLVGTALAFQMGIGFGLTVISIQLTPVFAGWVGGWRWAFLMLVPGPLIGLCAMLLLRALPESAQIAHGRR